MALPEKLYTLRKKSGLSQEQLAEALNVSRQAISKWEGGSAMPESDKLLALSNYFGVSLDYLLKDGAPDAAPAEAENEAQKPHRPVLLLRFGGRDVHTIVEVLAVLDDAQRRDGNIIALEQRGRQVARAVGNNLHSHRSFFPF